MTYDIKKRSEEELNSEFGSNWTGRYVTKDDGTEELVAVRRPNRGEWDMVRRMVEEGKKLVADTALVNAVLLTHTPQELKALADSDIFLEQELASGAVTLAQGRGRNVKKGQS